jgi:hypothetical protein
MSRRDPNQKAPLSSRTGSPVRFRGDGGSVALFTPTPSLHHPLTSVAITHATLGGVGRSPHLPQRSADDPAAAVRHSPAPAPLVAGAAGGDEYAAPLARRETRRRRLVVGLGGPVGAALVPEGAHGVGGEESCSCPLVGGAVGAATSRHRSPPADGATLHRDDPRRPVFDLGARAIGQEHPPPRWAGDRAGLHATLEQGRCLLG